MIVERNEFRLKFGKAKEAIAIWTQMMDEIKNQKDAISARLLHDLSGPAYTIVVEVRIRSFNDIGFKNYQWMVNPKVQELYQQFVPLCESAERTLYNEVHEI